MATRLETGRNGEDIAVQYLIDNGYSVVDRNFRKKFGEIDIIARDNSGTLIFFEVKTIRYSANGNEEDCVSPEDQMTKSKIEKMKRICSWYAKENERLIRDDRGWQMDLLTVKIFEKDNECQVKHYQNIV